MATNQVPLIHAMIPGSHERNGGPECRCGAAWNYWQDECLNQIGKEDA